ncbi:exodeoxyribonuclease VII large subunit [compost metagenome]
MKAAMLGVMKEKSVQLTSAVRQLDALSPLKVMGRGYSLIYDEHEKALIKSIDDVEPGDMLKVKVIDGELDCQVWGMRRKGVEGDHDAGTGNEL